MDSPSDSRVPFVQIPHDANSIVVSQQLQSAVSQAMTTSYPQASASSNTAPRAPPAPPVFFRKKIANAQKTLKEPLLKDYDESSVGIKDEETKAAFFASMQAANTASANVPNSIVQTFQPAQEISYADDVTLSHEAEKSLIVHDFSMVCKVTVPFAISIILIIGCLICWIGAIMYYAHVQSILSNSDKFDFAARRLYDHLNSFNATFVSVSINTLVIVAISLFSISTGCWMTKQTAIIPLGLAALTLFTTVTQTIGTLFTIVEYSLWRNNPDFKNVLNRMSSKVPSDIYNNIGASFSVMLAGMIICLICGIALYCYQVAVVARWCAASSEKKYDQVREESASAV